MEWLFILALFGYVIYLHARISDLTRHIIGGAHQLNNYPDFPKPGQGPRYQPAVQPAGNAAATTMYTPAPHRESALWKWISTDWPMKLGAFLVILGLGWFVSYAFAQNWIGPVGRITLGLVFGTVMLVAGFLRAKKESQQGTIIMVLGATAVLITTYAAREVYDFFTPLSALCLMAGVSAFIAFSSVTDKVMSRSLFGLLVGCIAPFLTVSADPSMSGLFLYLFVLLASYIWIFTITGWKELLVGAAAVYAIFSMGTLFDYIPTSEKPTMIVLITAFVIMFYGVGVISALMSKKVTLADVFVKLLAAGIFMLWVNSLVAEHWQSLVMVLASGLTALAAWGLQLQTTNKWLVVLHGSLSLVYLAVAVAFELEGAVALLAYIALTTTGAWLAGSITQNYKVGQLFGMPFVLLLFAAISDVSYVVKWSEIFVIASLAVAAGTLGFFWYSKHENPSNEFTAPVKELVIAYLYGALLAAVVFIWLSFGKLITNSDTAHSFALVTYTLAGVAMYGYGQLNGYNKTKIAGGVLFAGVIARLLFVEVWGMALVVRVIVFTLIGFLLMGVAFLRPQKKVI